MGRLDTYRKITVFLLLCSCLSLKAQIPVDQISGNTVEAFPKEIPKIVANSSLLLTGERLYYKVHNLSEYGKTSSLSKVSYVSLRTDRDSVIFDHKLRLPNDSAHGSFFIPTTLETGKYRLLSYTNYSLNNEENAVAERMVYIINPFVKPKTYVQKDSTRPRELLSLSKSISHNINQSAANGLSIITDKPSYKKREKISISIENLLGKFGYGNYVLSVRKIDPVEVPDPNASKGTVAIEKENIFYIPELRGELISGKVLTYDTNVLVANKVVTFSIPGKNYVFKTAKTDSNGQFFFSIDEPYETKNCIIQIDELDRELFKVVLDEKEIDFREKIELSTLNLDSSLKEWLEERSVQLQIENAYFQQDSFAQAEDYVKPFYGNLGTEFVLDDYTRFPSLEETFVEVVTLARVRKKDGKNSFEVFDPFNPYKTGQFSSLEPLLLLDGILVQDAVEIFGFSANEMESVKVFPNTYRYGPKIYQGIIDFKTKKREYNPQLGEGHIIEFELVRPFPNNKYSTPDHSNESHKRLPDYRTQLLWEPNVDLAQKEFKTEFYSSDVTGTYQIRLEGYTNKGNNVVIRKWFVVE